MENIIKLLNKHPNENRMNYFRHLINTFFLATFLGFYSIKILIHAFLPFLFIDSDHDCIKCANEYLKIIYKN